MHLHNIAHRDIKLENIMLSKRNDLSNLKIIDLGLAGTFHGDDMDLVAGTLF